MTPARALAIVRIAVGVLFLVRTTPILMPLGFHWAHAPLLGWPDGKFHIAIFSLPAWVVAALAIVRTLAAIAFTLGFRARDAGIVASVCAYVVLAQDALSYINTLHLLFMSTFLVAIADTSSSGLWLVRAIPLGVYVFSGIAKLNAQFLSGRTLIELRADGFLRGFVASFACASPGRAHAVSIAVVACELTLPFLLAFPRTRLVALVLAVTFHATIEVSMHPDLFGWIMITLLVAFIPGLPLRRGRSHT